MKLRDEATIIALATALLLAGAALGAAAGMLAVARGAPSAFDRALGCDAAEQCPVAP